MIERWWSHHVICFICFWYASDIYMHNICCSVHLRIEILLFAYPIIAVVTQREECRKAAIVENCFPHMSNSICIMQWVEKPEVPVLSSDLCENIYHKLADFHDVLPRWSPTPCEVALCRPLHIIEHVAACVPSVAFTPHGMEQIRVILAFCEWVC